MLGRRFSLFSLLMLTTTAVAVIDLVDAWKRIEAVRAAAIDRENELQSEPDEFSIELRKLRAEQGVLTIDDPEKIYAIRLPDFVKNVWRYRVNLPSGCSYYVAAQANIAAWRSDFKD